jgi:NET1-associated nuclear protein 1 (U3 small nucleolar RNA-associated protein 17)
MMGTIQKKNTNAKKGKAKANAPASRSKAPPTAVRNGKEIPWEWASITSPAVSKVPPVFTRDGKYVCHRVCAVSLVFT